MNGITKMYWLHALTPLHVGAGRGVGFIDLPVMREKVTGWPLVPGSAIKGVIADHYKAATHEQRSGSTTLRAAFGIADSDDATVGGNAGAIAFTDARLVCLPVRSYYGTFAWITSPLVLQRLKRDLSAAGLDRKLPDHCHIGDSSIHLGDINSELKREEKVYLEDLDLNAADCEIATSWSKRISQILFSDKEKEWRPIFQKRFAIVADNVFDFLCETAAQVDAHIRIKPETKTVVDGALWYEEALPAETILAGIACCDRVFSNKTLTETELMNDYCSTELSLQMGGKATTGKGRVRCVFEGSK